ncbi:hypothetical protein [Buchnera aphidicola]|uniref:hypothetical protein n=1 Tax=Buchnera aphidicola TaxID=9 RepID=UPI0005C4CF21|nr:hypothetical protein [Buchnera aphidicola]
MFLNLDLLEIKNLFFFELDFTRYSCLKLAITAYNDGYSATIILNVVNDISVSYFLKFKIQFTDIFIINSIFLSNLLSYLELKSFEDILKLDKI